MTLNSLESALTQKKGEGLVMVNCALGDGAHPEEHSDEGPLRLLRSSRAVAFAFERGTSLSPSPASRLALAPALEYLP